jgi:hypothetical protein
VSVTLSRAAKVGGRYHLALATIDELVIHDSGSATDQVGEAPVDPTRQLARQPLVDDSDLMPANISRSNLFHSGCLPRQPGMTCNCGVRGERPVVDA